MSENLYTPNCIRTFTGKYINPCAPDPAQICIEDISHSLSMQPRFGGHLPIFYSVAEHCISVARLLPPAFRLAGLLHDASEAYLIDVPRPVKQQLTNYAEIENRLMRVIAAKFGFEWPLPHEVKMIDEVCLHGEWDEIMLKDPKDCQHQNFPEFIKSVFLAKFNEYKKG